MGPTLRYTATGVGPQGVPMLIHMMFTPLDANTVRQFGETSTDGGKTWAMSFDLMYHRKK